VHILYILSHTLHWVGVFILSSASYFHYCSPASLSQHRGQERSKVKKKQFMKDFPLMRKLKQKRSILFHPIAKPINRVPHPSSIVHHLRPHHHPPSSHQLPHLPYLPKLNSSPLFSLSSLLSSPLLSTGLSKGSETAL
jgi:hypothetical protein